VTHAVATASCGADTRDMHQCGSERPRWQAPGLTMALVSLRHTGIPQLSDSMVHETCELSRAEARSLA
jgi:hypothetical protein